MSETFPVRVREGVYAALIDLSQKWGMSASEIASVFLLEAFTEKETMAMLSDKAQGAVAAEVMDWMGAIFRLTARGVREGTLPKERIPRLLAAADRATVRLKE